MKAMQKIFIAVAASIFIGANAQATMFWARPYDPNLQRWIQRDPIGEAGGNNLYGFVGNNPLNVIDPLGFEGNPVSSTLPGVGGAWPSNPDAPGGTFYDAGTFYNPPVSDEVKNEWIKGFFQGLDEAWNGDPNSGVMYGTVPDWLGGPKGLGALGKTEKLCEKTAKTVDELSQAGKALDKGGKLTKAGRAAQKHGSRPGSTFPPTKGNPAAINQQGQHALDDILTSPGQTSKPNRFGGQDLHAPDGRGARFDASGNFMGFLEP